jgi:ParB family chromosome partitioning protein
MTVKKNAFGGAIQKLSDLQRKKPAAIEGELIQKISPNQIECKPQIRKKDNPGFTEESLLELGNDIEQNGQGEPAIIRRHPNPESGFDYEMVAGERRQRACALKGLLLDCVVRILTDQQAKRIQRSENVQREGLTQLEIALALKADYEELQTLQAVADEWKKGLNWVAERLKYLEVMEKDGAGRAAVEQGLTADVSVVNDLNRLENLDQEAAAELLARADAEPDLNLRNEVRTSLKRTKSIRIGRSTSPKTASPEKASTDDDPIAMLNELVAVQAAQIKTLEEANAYLTSELQEARNKLAGDWKPE